MTQAEKLLLKDLCARLLYGVRVSAYMGYNDGLDSDWYEANLEGIDIWGNVRLTVGSNTCLYYSKNIEDIKPYLRPLSSMTDEERIELKYKTCPEGTGYFDEKALICPGNHYGEYIPYNFMSVILDWLLAHHFDVGNLIEKELALEAPKGMYETK